MLLNGISSEVNNQPAARWRGPATPARAAVVRHECFIVGEKWLVED
jgi:hypothetical protein